VLWLISARLLFVLRTRECHQKGPKALTQHPNNRHSALERRIRLVCPWAEPFLYRISLERDPAFLAARRAAAVARLNAGAARWREWATAIAELSVEGSSSLLEVMIAALTVTDFIEVTFKKAADFAGFLFPGELHIERARFEQEAYFNACTFFGSANFHDAVFAKRGAWFENSEFDRDAVFAHTQWKGAAEFRSTAFEGVLNFADAVFEKDLWIADAVFRRLADFSRASFAEAAGFSSSIFLGRVTFTDACFEGSAGFTDTIFGSSVSFERAIFESKAWFNRCRFDDAACFNLAEFRGDADFHDVDLAPQTGADASRLSELQRRFGS